MAEQAETSDRLVQVRAGRNIIDLGSPTNRDHFIDRRVETVRFLDEATAARSVEVHLRMARFADEVRWPRLDGLVLLPIARLERRDHNGARHTTIDLRDEHGGRLPRIPMVEERRLVALGVWHVARTALQRRPSSDTKATLRRIVLGTALVDDILGSADGEVLADDAGFIKLLGVAHRYFFLIAPLPYRRPERRVLTYSFRENPVFQPIITPKDLVARIWRPQPAVKVVCETPAAADCHSYHFELVAPPDLSVRRGQLVIESEALADPVAIPDDDRSDASAHAYWTGVGPLARAEFRARLVPQATGLIWALRAVVAATALLLVMGCAFTWSADGSTVAKVDASAVAALFALAPAIVTTALAVRTKHQLTSRMLYGPKIGAIAPSVALYAGALILVLHPPVLWMVRATWTVGAVGGTVCLIRACREAKWLRRVGSEPI